MPNSLKRVARFTLDIDYDFDFSLLGISCHSRDYRLCFNLNRSLSFSLVKQDNIQLNIKPGVSSSFSIYKYQDEDRRVNYTLISNKGTLGMLIPEQRQADYLVMVNGLSDEELTDLIKGIKMVEGVLTAFPIDVNGLKSKQNLLF